MVEIKMFPYLTKDKKIKKYFNSLTKSNFD